jgi:hypothetical protein
MSYVRLKFHKTYVIHTKRQYEQQNRVLFVFLQPQFWELL